MASPEDTYKYTPSSSHATRAVLTSASTSTQPQSPINPADPPTSTQTDAPFRPQVFRRKSTNYADAAAAALEATASSADASLPQEDGQSDGRSAPEDTTGAGTGKAGGSVAWKPAFGRKQSWNRQDLKHSMQMSQVGDPVVDEQGLKGYTAAKST